jgi:hypothetical protein
LCPGVEAGGTRSDPADHARFLHAAPDRTVVHGCELLEWRRPNGARLTDLRGEYDGVATATFALPVDPRELDTHLVESSAFRLATNVGATSSTWILTPWRADDNSC